MCHKALSSNKKATTDNPGVPPAPSLSPHPHTSNAHGDKEVQQGLSSFDTVSHASTRDAGGQVNSDGGSPVTTVPQPGAPSPVLPAVFPPPVRFARTALVEKLVGDPVDPRSSLSPTGTMNATTHNPGDFVGGHVGHTAALATAAPAAASPGLSFRSPVRSSPTAVAAAAPVLTSPVSSERLVAASNWKMCFKDDDLDTGQAAVGCEGFSKQFAGMQHVIEDLAVHSNELAVQLQAARDALSLSRSNEQRSLTMAALAASSTSRKPDHGRIKSFETRFTKEANRFNADGSITVEAFFQELEHDFYAHSVDGSTPGGLAQMRGVLISCLGPKVRGEHVRLRKEFETDYPPGGQPLEYDRTKSTMLVRYHLPGKADEMRDAWAALKQKQEETMRDFLIKIDNQVDLLDHDAKGILILNNLTITGRKISTSKIRPRYLTVLVDTARYLGRTWLYLVYQY
eukprot:SAG11_NODE_660_length_7893_cov_4.055042_10_plen_456_part_00